MALSTKTLDALNDSRKTEPHKYIWGQFTPDKEGVGYADLPEQTDIPDDAKLVLDVNGPSLVTASITSIRGGLSGRIATTEKAGIVKPDGTTISVSSDGTISSSTTEAQWGHITGTLSEQTDLQNVLDTIPTKTSQLTNDSGYIKRVPHASSTTYGTVKVVYDSATKTLNIIN